MERWTAALSDSGLETADISAGLAAVFSVSIWSLFCHPALLLQALELCLQCCETGIDEKKLCYNLQVKDPSEQLAVKKAAHLAASCWKNFAVPEIEGEHLQPAGAELAVVTCHAG